MDVMTGLVVAKAMSTLVPVEVKAFRHSNPVLSGFYSIWINAVLFCIYLLFSSENYTNKLLTIKK